MSKRMRGPNPIQSLRQAIEHRDEAPSRTAYLEDEVHKQSLEQLLPQIAAESEQAAKSVREVFYYYRKKLSGRRCSCFSIETSPDGFCQICFGSGYVGGWDLHGCRTEVIDVTHPNLKLVNTRAGFDLGMRPTPFILEEGCKKGYIETEINLVRSINTVNLIAEYAGGKRKGVSATVYIRRMSETTFVKLNTESLQQRLNESKLVVRIELERNNAGLPSIQFSHLLIRYQLIPDVRMYGDKNLAEESFELGDLGFTDSYTTMSLYVPRSFDHIRNEDFMIRISDLKRFKVTRFERNCVSGVLLSHTVQARLLVHGSDTLLRVP